MATASREIRALVASRDEQAAEIAGYEEQTAAAQSNIASLKQDIAVARRELQLLVADRDEKTDEIAEFREQADRAQADIATLKKAIAEGIAKIESLTSEIQDQTVEIVGYEQLVGSAQSEINRLKRALAEAEGRVETLIADNIEQSEQIEAHLQQIARGVSDARALELALSLVRDEIGALTKSKGRDETIEDFALRVSGAFSELDTLRLAATDYQEQIGLLENERSKLEVSVGAQSRQIEERDAVIEVLNKILADERTETDKALEEARLAAAQREATELLLEKLRIELEDTRVERDAKVDNLTSENTLLLDRIGAAEAARIADAALLDELQRKLGESEAIHLAQSRLLEEKRREAEETLTMLAAAQEKAGAREAAISDALSESKRNAGLLAVANEKLEREEALAAESQRRIALLNIQVNDLTKTLNELQATLDFAVEKDEAGQVEVQILGERLNQALAQVAAEEAQRADLEKKLRVIAEREAKNLERFRSDFLENLRDVIEGQEGVRIVGDRFVFSSEVLFARSESELSPAGQVEIDKVAQSMLDLAKRFPDTIDWVLRIDGHTDDVPVISDREFKDNWDLSVLRSLSVVRYLIEEHGFPPARLAATGFGQHRPVIASSDEDARSQNRRIEFKLTER